jgi:transposase-like protein
MTKSFSDAEKAKLKTLVTEGIQVLQETETLKEALGDTVKAIAEELEIKPAILNKVIRTAYKADLEEKQSVISDIEDILLAVGR